MHKRSFWLIIWSIMSLFPAAGTGEAAASDSIKGWYVGGGVAATNVFANRDIGLSAVSERGSGDTGFVINGGYRFNRYLAVEIGYLDGGEPSFQKTSTVNISQETEAFEATAVGLLPFLKIWEVYMKGGAAFWDASSQQTFGSMTGETAASRLIDKDGIDFLLGVGFGVTVWKKLHLRFEYQAFRTDDELLALTDDREARFDAFIAEVHWRLGKGWSAGK